MARRGVLKRSIFLQLRKGAIRKSNMIRQYKRLGIPYTVDRNGLVQIGDN